MSSIARAIVLAALTTCGGHAVIDPLDSNFDASDARVAVDSGPASEVASPLGDLKDANVNADSPATTIADTTPLNTDAPDAGQMDSAPVTCDADLFVCGTVCCSTNQFCYDLTSWTGTGYDQTFTCLALPAACVGSPTCTCGQDSGLVALEYGCSIVNGEFFGTLIAD